MFTPGPDENVVLSSTELQGTSHLLMSTWDDIHATIHQNSLASSTHLPALTISRGNCPLWWVENEGFRLRGKLV